MDSNMEEESPSPPIPPKMEDVLKMFGSKLPDEEHFVAGNTSSDKMHRVFLCPEIGSCNAGPTATVYFRRGSGWRNPDNHLLKCKFKGDETALR
jgi:hypothetical protein